MHVPTFADAVESYRRLGGEVKYLGRVLERIGGKPVADVNAGYGNRGRGGPFLLATGSFT